MITHYKIMLVKFSQSQISGKISKNMSHNENSRLYDIAPNIPDFSALAILLRNIVMNHSREYWYIGSILAKSVTQKKRICVLTATGIYLLLVMSISCSVCSATDILDCGGVRGCVCVCV